MEIIKCWCDSRYYCAKDTFIEYEGYAFFSDACFKDFLWEKIWNRIDAPSIFDSLDELKESGQVTKSVCLEVIKS